MPPKKKIKKKPSANSAKKEPKRVAKPKINRKNGKKKLAAKRVAAKPAPTKSNSKKSRKKAASVNAETELKREFQGRKLGGARLLPARTSEDFKGLSRVEQADSESVDELVEEGNVFEAGVVAGVQRADDEDEQEVRTREVPEDDVPEEYLDED